LGLTLVTPPRYFYRLRQWYAAKGLRRMRRVLGEPKVAGPTIQKTLEGTN